MFSLNFFNHISMNMHINFKCRHCFRIQNIIIPFIKYIYFLSHSGILNISKESIFLTHPSLIIVMIKEYIVQHKNYARILSTVKQQTMYTHSCAGALHPLVCNCNSLIVKGFLCILNTNRILVTLFSFFILEMSFFNSETILLIDRRNLLHFNGCILKGT